MPLVAYQTCTRVSTGVLHCYVDLLGIRKKDQDFVYHLRHIACELQITWQPMNVTVTQCH